MSDALIDTPEGAFDEALSPGAAAWLGGRGRVVAALLGAAFFFTPLIAAAVGVRPQRIENRPLVGLPSLSRGFGVFDGLTQWSIDHLPLRSLAVKADAHLSQGIFGEPPSYTAGGAAVGVGQNAALAGGRNGGAVTADAGSRVVRGHHGWLFIADEFIEACRPSLSTAQVTVGLRRLDAMLQASGRRLVVTMAPDKDTVDGRFVDPGQTADAGCAAQGHAARYAALRSTAPPSFVDLVSPLQALERRTGTPAYLPGDTHWDDRATATVFLPGLLDPLSPGLLRGARVVSGPPQPYVGDLSALSGSSSRALDPRYAVSRPGVTPGTVTMSVPFANFPVTHATATARSGVPLVRGHTLIYGDSFTERALPELLPFFADVTRVPEISRGAVEGARGAAVQALLDQLSSADVVIVEQAERLMAGSPVGSILAPDVLDAMQAALARAPRGRGLQVR